MSHHSQVIGSNNRTQTGPDSKPARPPISQGCTEFNTFGEKQTGYYSEIKMKAFLNETFPGQKEFGLEVWSHISRVLGRTTN